MKRLIKKSNNVEPFINNEVEDKVIHPDTNKNENQRPAFLLAKELFASTPFIQASSLNYEFARKIENGDYEHISSIEDAKGHWEEWLAALTEFLKEKELGEKEANLKKKTVANQNNLYGDEYTDHLMTDDYLDRDKDNPNKQPKQPKTDKEHFISNSFLAAKDIIYSLPIVPRYDLMSQLAQDIERGDFDDLGDFQTNKDAWLNRAKTILRSRNIILS